MKFARQVTLSLVAVAVAIGIWAVYVPAAAPLLARVGVYEMLGLEPPGDPGAAQGERGGFGGGPAQVMVAPAGEGRVNARVQAIGDGRALRSVTVRSEASGLIRDLAIAPGTYVAEGALIAQLDDDAQRIALERSRLMVADAASDLERLRALSASGAVPEVQLRAAELALRTAELAVEEAEFELQQRRITAPIPGWVGLLEVAQGDRIGAQAVIAMIADRSRIDIDFRIPERFIAGLSLGMSMDVTSLAQPDVVLPGEIVALDNAVDRASRTLRVQGRLDNADDSLRAGQAFSVALSFPGETLPSVDPLAIQWSGDGSFVWRARDGVAERVPVTIRQRTSAAVLVEGALEPGDAVITEGVQALRPGAEVRIVNGPGAEAGTVAAQEAAALNEL